ncbi:peptidyl-dipeptidase Dcp [Moheibacter sediminis]|uniref:Peptidyl-dipeptidase Dcp n=2 Tax=Moheibacter sediminis TaxID=1434700 RepID=A0A1W1ZC18_9FLAO|nr:peptidyl-dipeptidase Dcp [Moheibacter sediminis]
MTACKKDASTDKSENPFFTEYETPYQVPPFDKIKNEHFEPAFIEGFKAQTEEINKIANETAEPTFENTIIAMENSGKLLKKTLTVFFNLTSSNTNDTLQALAQKNAPLLSKHNDDIYLNEKLFQRVKSVYENQDKFNLNPEQKKLLEEKYKKFVRSGANLNAEGKNKLRKLNEELSVLSVKFGDNLLSEINNYELVVDKKENLTGLPESLVESAANTAKEKGKEGKWIFTLQNASVMPFLQFADNRDLRKEIWTAYQNRGNNGNEFDNKELAIKQANLRNEKAKLLGYTNHAAYVLEESMAKTPEKAFDLLNQLWKPALENAKKEEAEIAALMKADGINDAVQPYDWRYYTEKLRKQKFDLEESEIKPYFAIDNVRDGVFMVTEKLYGLKFEQLTNLPIYHKDVTTWKVTEADGKEVGILYMDMHPRESKRGGAWMSSFREQKMENGKRILPVVTIVCNFTQPTADAPALLTYDETITFFHEFGHALHGLLSNVTYESLSGTNVSRDFVELPSQVMENWAADPEVLKMYAKHYKTGEIIPDALIQKLEKSGTFDQGFATTEYLAASLLDLDYHTQAGNITKSVTDFEKESMQKLGLISSIIPRYKSTYFQHIFAGGYSAGYYSYIWSGVLDTDAYSVFKSTSLFNQEKAQSFRKNILEKGNTEDAMELYKKFRGSEPSIEPLLKKRGLTVNQNNLKN